MEDATCSVWYYFPYFPHHRHTSVIQFDLRQTHISCTVQPTKTSSSMAILKPPWNKQRPYSLTSIHQKSRNKSSLWGCMQILNVQMILARGELWYVESWIRNVFQICGEHAACSFCLFWLNAMAIWGFGALELWGSCDGGAGPRHD
jgi:hypothetical protein